MTVIRLEFSESVTVSDASVWTGLGCSTGCWTGIWGWAIIGCCITWGWSESLLFPLFYLCGLDEIIEKHWNSLDYQEKNYKKISG